MRARSQSYQQWQVSCSEMKKSDADNRLILLPVAGILGTLWGNSKGILTAERKVL